MTVTSTEQHETRESPMANIHDVARAAGVSISTVSYALSGKRSIAESTRRRVEEAARSLGYQPNAAGRMLAGTRTRILALTAPLREDTYAPAHMTFVLAVATAARRHDYDILLLTEDEATKGLRRVASSRLVDGIIVLDVSVHDERVALVRELGVPSALIGIPDDPDGLYCVDLDFEAAAALAVDRLADVGHRRIALVGHPQEIYDRGSNFPLRLRDGYLARMRERGLEPVVVTPDTSSPSVRAATAELFDGADAPTALLLHCQESVQTTMLDLLRERGLSVPGDVSVVTVASTFDTTRLDPPLDVIPLLAPPSCEAAVDYLVRALEGDAAPRIELVAPEYRAFGSIAPVAAPALPATPVLPAAAATPATPATAAAPAATATSDLTPAL
ncbi:LacI family transcriptional regulator [Agromyces atrinae]|uniref:LacI family DNA-binding transcriptional regulator n=1 Tax=Agromyces atrinae TaxID=592376 RepID=UPI001F59FDB2|nr:LacI family DNA-binding transcriptional regulator [Agromyces atrinae]MCI2957616.1 LacI family transcriptional regulator [Agromyces atrinae]